MTELGVYGERLAESSLRVFESAVEESRRNRQNYVSFGHILKALAAEDADAFAAALRGSRAESLLTGELIEKMVAGGPDWRGRGVRISQQVISLFRRARRIMQVDGREKIEAADLFSALEQNVEGGKSLVFLRVSTPHSLVVQG
jgi:ATP-dependent Clp protease ATP-binding subunit ClpA